MNPDQLTQLREEALRWIFSMLGAIMVYSLVAVIAQGVYHPDVEQLRAIGNNMLTDPGLLRPEPVEALLFRLAVIIIIPGFILFYAALAKKPFISKLSQPHLYNAIAVLSIFCIVVLLYADFCADNPFGPNSGDAAQNKRDRTAATNFAFYFEGLFLGNYLLIYTLVFVPAVAYLFFAGIKKYRWDEKRTFKIITSVAGYGITIAAIAVIALMTTFRFPYSSENKVDFSAVYYAMTQVYAGLPMLVNGFSDTYGLYPQFLNPLFQLTGLSIFKFSLVLSLLTAAGFFLNMYSLRKLVSNNVIFSLGMTSILFFPYLDFKLTNTFDCFFSYYPIRYIIPSTLLCLTFLYITKRSAWLYYVTFVLSALFVLWNPEIGLVCYLSWLLTNIYLDLYTAEGRLALKKILLHVSISAGVLVAVLYGYKAIIYLAYGSWPDFNRLFGTIFIFGKVGFGLLPMVLIHPWNLMAIIVLLGFAYSLIPLYKKTISVKSAMVFLISLIALGYFVYFQGRSQNTNFATSSGYCLLLLTILGDELWTKAKGTNDLLLNGLFTVFLFIMSFSFIEIIFNSKALAALIYQEEDKNNFIEAQGNIEAGKELIQRTSKEHEKIHILAQRKNQSLLFDGDKRQSAFNPGFTDLFLQTDIKCLEQMLVDSSFSVYMEPTKKSYGFMSRPLSALGAVYEYKDVNKLTVLLTKRKTAIPKDIFFKKDSGLILYRKYSDDTASIALRINDALSGAPIATGNEFVVNVLFYNTLQVFPMATLAGNTLDGPGFSIGKVLMSSNLFFSLNKQRFTCPIPDNQWTYLVMNVHPDHIDIYENGIFYATQKLKEPIGNSRYPIVVGNIYDNGNAHFYIGAIAEVSIGRNIVDSNQIKATWREIDNVVNKH